ncbi:MAG: hypothetical protein WCJ42_07670 [Actinomycetes bacterium]
MTGAPFLVFGYGLATVLYGGYFLRMALLRRTLQHQLRAKLEVG